MEERWQSLAVAVADWVTRRQFAIYLVLGVLAWLLVLRGYPLESLTPIYANY
jgi:hypothetical protein